MSFQAVSRIVRACGVKSSRQFLGRKLPCRVGERNLYIKQEKRPATREEMGILVLGLGVLSSASVWAWKEGAFSSVLTPDEQAKLKEREEGN